MTEQTPMTQEQLNAIQERVDAATRGPWAHDFCGNVDQVETQAHATGTRIADNLTPGDADLIAHAPQDLTDLLAEVKRLRALTTVDDAMVERAARALYLRESDWSSEAKWDRLPEFARESWRKTARAALDAALGTGVES